MKVHVRKDDTAKAAGGTSVEKLTCELSYRHQYYFRSPKGPATAKIHRMTLVTRNIDNIADLDVSILNPFGAQMRYFTRFTDLDYTTFVAICSCRGDSPVVV